MRRLPPALCLCLLLAACAEVWTRPGATEADAEATNAACRDHASRAVPPRMVWTLVERGGFQRYRRCGRDRDGQARCWWETDYRPPRYAWVDANELARDAWRRECMREKGFTFQGHRALRLQ